MTKLQPVDKVEIQVLVYNATDGLSTTPPNVENEFAFATHRGLHASSGRCLCCAVHGFSVLLTATRGGVNEEIIPQTVKAIREFGLTQIAAVIALAGVPSRRPPRHSATTWWLQRRSGSGTLSKGLRPVDN
jgi:hypothetical protein